MRNYVKKYVQFIKRVGYLFIETQGKSRDPKIIDSGLMCITYFRLTISSILIQNKILSKIFKKISPLSYLKFFADDAIF